MNQAAATNTDSVHSLGAALLNQLATKVGPIFTMVQPSEAGAILRIPAKQAHTFVRLRNLKCT